MAASGKAHTNEYFPELMLLMSLSPQWATDTAFLCSRTSITNKSGTVSYGVTAFFTWVLWAWDFVCTLQEWSLSFSQSCGSPRIKPHWLSKSEGQGIPPPIAGPPGWEAWLGAQNFHSCGITSVVLLFSKFECCSPNGYEVWFYCCCTLPTSHCSFVFVFGCRVIFLGRFQHYFVNGCSAISCDFGVFIRMEWAHVLLLHQLELISQ